jgi:N-acetylmuramoyl-L-alanine amidase
VVNAKVMPINVKRLFHTFLVSTFIAFLFSTGIRGEVPTDPPKGIRTIVIDAGHGGRDPGAVGKNGKEKDIALAIALKVGTYIEENIPDVKVIYTRKTDVFVELIQRAEIANNAEADLFLSIHVNAHTRSSASGTLTLVLGQHRADENFDVAVRENSVILLEEDYEITYEGFDPKSTESYIMFSLMQKTFFKQSIQFGDYVQDQFRERASRKDLGVREQGILVLAQTSMPGVLVETGFISNPEEEKYLLTQYGQEIIASAIYRGFKEYKEEIDRKSKLTVVVADESAAAITTVPEAGPDPHQSEKVIFSIQLASSKNKIATNPSSFKGYEHVMVIQDGRWFKYLLGTESNYHTALEKCKAIKSDYPDAFVVASKGGKIVPLNEALEEINY